MPDNDAAMRAHAANGPFPSFDEPAFTRPKPLPDARVAIVTSAAESHGLSYLAMPSGAGHDAQSLAAICPLGMIFVPSRAGISHAPEEYTSPAQITDGANVLLSALLRSDAEFD